MRRENGRAPDGSAHASEDLDFSSSPKDFSTNYLVERRERLESHLGGGISDLEIGGERKECTHVKELVWRGKEMWVPLSSLWEAGVSASHTIVDSAAGGSCTELCSTGIGWELQMGSWILSKINNSMERTVPKELERDRQA